MKVVFKNAALADIEAIGDYIAKDSPSRSVSFVEQIKQHPVKIGEFPETYAIVDKFRMRGIRRCVFGNYLIFYRIAQSRVEILQIVHGANSPTAWRL